MGVDPPVFKAREFDIEFLGDNAEKNCLAVSMAMKELGMLFRVACDYLEMREGYHFKQVSK